MTSEQSEPKANKPSKKSKLTDSEIESIANAELKASIGFVSGEISTDREEAMDFYNGEPMGDEQEGHSKVISRDVLDTVEWMLPGLIEIFCSGDNVVEFKPQGAEDEAYADQATDYCNFIFNNDNNGFLILYDAFKDALLQKVGVVKVWWEDLERDEVSTFTGLDDLTYIALTGDDDVEIDAHSEETDAETGMVLHDVTIRRSVMEGRIRLACVPPDEFIISGRSSSLESARLVGHRRDVTRSELIEMGFDRKTVEGIGANEGDAVAVSERQARFSDEETGSSNSASDDSMRSTTFVEAYMRIDVNDDGKAELVKVSLAGSGEYKLLDWEEVDQNPFADFCPVRTPHKFYGHSLADLVKDIQLIKTTLLRQTLDNLYLSNNPEREVVVSLVANMDDFLVSRPGGLKRVLALNASREISTPFVAGASFQALQYLDGIKESRTGSQPGVVADAEALQNQSATAANLASSALAQRQKMIARLFAETGMRDMFRKILRLTVKHQDQERMIKLRGEWVPIDPRGWNAEMDATVNVGLGHGNRSQQLAAIGQIMQLQEKLVGAGGAGTMVLPKNLYASIERFINLAGFKNAGQFVNDPGEAAFPPPPPQPDQNAGLVEAEKVKAQASIQSATIRAQTDMMMASERGQKEMAMQAADLRFRSALEVAKLAAEAQSQQFDAASKLALANLNSELAKQEDAHAELVKQLGGMADAVIRPPQPPMIG